MPRDDAAAECHVLIVEFPRTRVASIRHDGPGAREHETVRKLIAWKFANGLTDPSKHRHYGLHYLDPGHGSERSRVNFCLSIDAPVEPNPHGIVEAVIPALRCARARDIGSRNNNRAAPFLVREWLPASEERVADFPLIFHYLNVGPNVRDEDAITDVYLPLL